MFVIVRYTYSSAVFDRPAKLKTSITVATNKANVGHVKTLFIADDGCPERECADIRLIGAFIRIIK